MLDHGGNMQLFFDTETTGLPSRRNAPATDYHSWPRMVQLAWLMTDEHGYELSSAEHIIRPAGFVIPPEATKIHGITTDVALDRGTELATVLDEFQEALYEASTVLAHNMSFDERVVGSEFIRAGRRNLIEGKKRVCTMKSSTRYCGLPGRHGYKWPTLTELHMHLFGESFEDEHHALADVRACVRCYQELKRLKIMA